MPSLTYKVFIVDDDIDDLELLEEAFSSAQCISEVRSFKASNTLLTTLNSLVPSQKPDIIIMDHNMPLMNGRDLIKNIRSNSTNKGVVLAIYSSMLVERKIQEMLTEGLDCYLAKGSSFNEMQEHVKFFCKAIDEKRIC
jgi:DNA-binding response OmpR family regulator